MVTFKLELSVTLCSRGVVVRFGLRLIVVVRSDSALRRFSTAPGRYVARSQQIPSYIVRYSSLEHKQAPNMLCRHIVTLPNLGSALLYMTVRLTNRFFAVFILVLTLQLPLGLSQVRKVRLPNDLPELKILGRKMN